MAFTDDKSTLNPEKTPLFVGQGVIINGAIVHDGSKDDRAVILGELRGDITWNGIVQVTQGGTISSATKISCRELVVAGNIHGSGVVIEAGVLRLEPTANVQVEEVLLPPGGLEQSRGSFFTGRLNMQSEHKFADMALPPPETNNGSAARSNVATPPRTSETNNVSAALSSVTTRFAAFQPNDSLGENSSGT